MGDGRTGERHTRHSPNELGHFIYLNRRAAAHHLFRWRAAVCRGLPFRPRSLDGRSTVPDSSSWDGQQAAHSGRRRVYKGWPALVALLGAPNMCTTLAVISGSFSSSMRCNGDMHERAAWSLDRGRLTCWSDAIGDWRDGRHGKGLRQVEREAKLKQSKRVAISLSVGRILPYCNPEFLTFAPPLLTSRLGGLALQIPPCHQARTLLVFAAPWPNLPLVLAAMRMPAADASPNDFHVRYARRWSPCVWSSWTRWTRCQF